jgi:hypothetical protein
MHNQAEFVVGWGTLSFINAGLAQSKNRSGLLWWLASLFLGPNRMVSEGGPSG